MEHHNSSKSRLIEVTGMLHSVTNDRDVRERMFHFMDLNEDGFLDQEEVLSMASLVEDAAKKHKCLVAVWTGAQPQDINFRF